MLLKQLFQSARREMRIPATIEAGERVTIRLLGQPGDLGWVVMAHGEVYAEEFGWDTSFEALVARIVADYAEAGRDPRREAAWIAEIDGRRTGCVFCVADPARRGTALLRILLVHPDGRGRDLGRRLVDACLDFARAARYERVRLWTNHPLAAARRIYLERGFQLIDAQPHHSFGVELIGQTYELDLRHTVPAETGGEPTRRGAPGGQKNAVRTPYPATKRQNPPMPPSTWRSLGMQAALAAIIALAACGASKALPIQARPSPVARPAAGPPAHIAVILMENHEYGDIIGSSSAPYINSLAKSYGLATGMYAISHPSLPNYLALTGGSTFGITSDCTDCTVGSTSIVNQLDRAHISWRAYMQDLPRPCFTGPSAGGYAKKHDPFAYYTRIVANARRCASIVALTRLSADERRGSLPRFLWISPNLCNDMHDCSVSTGDRFLSGLVPSLLRSLGPRGLLFLTWDEGSSDAGCCRLASGGHVATIVAGPGARAGARLGVPTDHYSVLQTIEDQFGLGRLRGAACACTPSLAPLLSRG
jgi:GNAT superfamily N-acetyltransferase